VFASPQDFFSDYIYTPEKIDPLVCARCQVHIPEKLWNNF